MSSTIRAAGLGLALLIGLSAGTALAQPPGGRPGGGRPDPSQFFDMMAQGKDVVVRDQLAPQFQGMFDRFAQRMGITDGKMTRQQFLDYMAQRAARRAQGAPGGSAGASGANSWVESMFRRYDRRGDGQLTYSELPEEMKAEYKRWDTNGDGFIDLNEFRAYAQARIQQLQAERGSRTFPPVSPVAPPAAKKTPPPEPEPTFYRRDKLPKEVPDWFTQIDTDGDGQIGVYEWRKSGRPFSEFKAMDQNDDGFITIEEIVHYVRANTTPDAGKTGTATASAAGTGARSGTMSGTGAANASGGPGDQMGRRGRGFFGNGPPGSGEGGRRFGNRGQGYRGRSSGPG